MVAGLAGSGIARYWKHRQTMLSFNNQLEKVQRRYFIEEYACLGPRLIFYVEDIHMSDFNRQNRPKIEFLVSQCGIELLGLEGVIDRPESEAEQRSRQRVSDLINTGLEGEEDRAQELLGLAVSRPVNDGPTNYRYCFEDRRLRTLGLENELLLSPERCSALIACQLIYDVATSHEKYLLEIDGRLTRGPKRVEMARNAGLLPNDFPTFDMDRFQLEEYDNKKVRFARGDRDSAWLEQLNSAWESAMAENSIRRTVYAANKLMDEMETNDYTQAVVVFGRWHADRRYQPCFQSEFEKRGFSYIILELRDE